MGNSPASRFSLTFIAGPDHIDFMGHVNNAVWLQWAQDIAVAHWEAAADPAHVAAYLWVVTRHEIDYRGNIAEGESVIAETRIEQSPSGARFERLIDFARETGGRPIVSVRSTWAMIARDTGRLMRVPVEVSRRFVG